MADDAYITLPIEVDYDAMVAEAFDALMAAIEGWVPREGHLEVQLIEVIMRQMAENQAVASRVPPAIFKNFGQSLMTIPAIEAARASMQSTWTARDTLGHTITAGTVVAYSVAADKQIYFTVANDVVVAPGGSTTANGEVTLVALTPGADANGLPPSASAVMVVDALAWVDQITSTTTSSGGVDAETDEEYLDRLRGRLRLLTPRPIHADDFAVLALDVAGVDRARAIDGYNATLGTYNNERVVTVAVADENGNAVSSGVKSEVATYLDGLREVNFSVYVIDPNYVTINVVASVAKFEDADAGEVEAACEAALEAYFDPKSWDWSSTTVRRNELIALLSNVEGVDYVLDITQPAANVVMSGPAPLAMSGTTAVSVV